MEIRNSTISDIEEIFRLYETAIAYQKKKGAVPWAGLLDMWLLFRQFVN